MNIAYRMMLAAAAFGAVASSAPADAQRVVIGIGGGWHPWHERVYYGYGGPRWYGVPGPRYGWYGWRGGYYRNCGWRLNYHRFREWRCW